MRWLSGYAIMTFQPNRLQRAVSIQQRSLEKYFESTRNLLDWFGIFADLIARELTVSLPKKSP